MANRETTDAPCATTHWIDAEPCEAGPGDDRAGAVAATELEQETDRLIALCEAPSTLWAAPALETRPPEPFGMIA